MFIFKADKHALLSPDEEKHSKQVATKAQSAAKRG